MNKLPIMWAAFQPNGQMMSWIGALPTRRQVIHEAVRGGMSANEYYAYGEDSTRWKHCYRRGFRVKRVRLVRDGGE
jgi:hypothetical protein